MTAWNGRLARAGHVKPLVTSPFWSGADISAAATFPATWAWTPAFQRLGGLVRTTVRCRPPRTGLTH
jgi:hypothetical protein